MLRSHNIANDKSRRVVKEFPYCTRHLFLRFTSLLGLPGLFPILRGGAGEVVVVRGERRSTQCRSQICWRGRRPEGALGTVFSAVSSAAGRKGNVARGEGRPPRVGCTSRSHTPCHTLRADHAHLRYPLPLAVPPARYSSVHCSYSTVPFLSSARCPVRCSVPPSIVAFSLPVVRSSVRVLWSSVHCFRSSVRLFRSFSPCCLFHSFFLCLRHLRMTPLHTILVAVTPQSPYSLSPFAIPFLLSSAVSFCSIPYLISRGGGRGVFLSSVAMCSLRSSTDPPPPSTLPDLLPLFALRYCAPISFTFFSLP